MSLNKREWVAEQNEEALFLDGYDACIVGVAERFGVGPVAAYDYDAIIEKLVAGGLTYDDAVEHFEFNIIGAWVGDNTPIFVRKIPAA